MKLILNGLIVIIAATFMGVLHAQTLLTINPYTVTRGDLLDSAGNPVIRKNGKHVRVVTGSAGSFFAMGSSVVGLEQGSDGGVLLGAYQNFVLDPDVPHPQGWKGDTNGDGIPDGAAGTGYGKAPVVESNAFMPFKFFGVSTYIGLNPLSYQSGQTHGAPDANINLSSCVNYVCDMTANFSSWEVMWNSSAFDQGPRPKNTGPFVLADGTYNLLTQEYALDWISQIKQGPFNGVPAKWHLEGTVKNVPAVPVPAAIWLFGSGLLMLVGFARRSA